MKRGVRLLQGYLWAPKTLAFDPRAYLPETVELEGESVYLLLDPVTPPFAFFDDGTPTATQTFYQFTALVVTEADPEHLRPLVLALRDWLTPHLEATPSGVGWLLFEDLREV